MPTAPPLIIGLGEILWDMLPGGRQLGGAPANFAYHAAALGARGAVMSQVGDDPLGRDILQCLDRVGLDRSQLRIDPHHPTGVVNVQLDAAGVPSYIIRTGSAWDFLQSDEAMMKLAAQASAVCFGTLGSRSPQSRRAIHDALDATNGSCLRVFDINLRQHFYDRELIEQLLGKSEVLKLNDQELPVVANMLGIGGDDDAETCTEIARRYSLRMLALTRGPNGSLLVAGDGSRDDHGGFPCQIADTVGAGDAFTAALVLGLLEGHSLRRINTFANRLAAYVCSRHGAMPEIPQALRQQRQEGE